MEEKYFVTSDGAAPLRIFFSLAEAAEFGSDFIDSFDCAGEFIKAYKKIVDTTDWSWKYKEI